MQELFKFISNHSLLSIAAVGVFILIIIIELLRARRMTFNLSPNQATQKINHDQAVVIDLRNKELFKQSHIIDAYSLTADEIKQFPKKLEKFKLRPLILVGNTNMESQKIASGLLKAGYNAYSLSGGMRNWIEAQMPVVKNGKD